MKPLMAYNLVHLLFMMLMVRSVILPYPNVIAVPKESA